MDESILEYSRARLQVFLHEIKKLKDLEFPYEHSLDALDAIENKFRTHLNTLNQITDDTHKPVVNIACNSTLEALFDYLPLLGFLVRSTNVRNAFEIYGPLLQLARDLFGDNTKLIISSEWDYSPYTYSSLREPLENFILIGLPAPESQNPLLVPLAGHEFGHSLWRLSSFAKPLTDKIDASIISYVEKNWETFNYVFPTIKKDELATDLFASHEILPAFQWAAAQIEEVFCDLVGLRLFGEAFLHAFAYLLSPSAGPESLASYPRITKRITYILDASKAFGIKAPDGYMNLFEEPAPPQIAMNQTNAFLLSAAEQATDDLASDVRKAADSSIPSELRASPEFDCVNAIVYEFETHIVPTRRKESLCDIVRAGWLAAHRKDLWKNRPEITDREDLLKSLVLKSCEVLHYHQIVKEVQ